MTIQPSPGSPDGADGKQAYAGYFPEPPHPLFTETPPPPPYPIPDSMEAAAQELVQITGSADRLAALALQAAYNALSLHWYCVTGFSTRMVRPIGLIILAGEETTSRKSAVLRRAFAAHYEADAAAKQRWEDAQREARRRERESKRKQPSEGASLADDDLQQVPRVFVPTMVADDFTIEKMEERLADGRPSQIAMSTEATAVMDNFSFRKNNRGQSMSVLSKLYGGDPISYDRARQGRGESLYLPAGYSFALCWFAQVGPAKRFALSKEATQGFASRCLFAANDHPQVSRLKDIPTPHLDRTQEIFRQLLAWQNVGIEYQSRAANQKFILYPNPRTRELLELFEDDCEERRDGTLSEHAQGFWGRASENVARVGGNIRASELYQGLASEYLWDEHDLEQAVAIIRWHGEMLEAQTESNEDTETAKLAAAVAYALPQGVWWESRSSGDKRPDGLTIPLLTWMQHAHIPGSRLKNETKKKHEIADLLAGHGYVARVSGHKGSHGGRYAVSPYIL